ncbi:MAG TPA: ABC transporter permease [Burkholderiales bacterium]|nr:ABC transporter permease [Burkholderiales bacterium]
MSTTTRNFSLRFVHVWRRNLLVWRKLAIPSVLGNLADPLLYMVGLGYGLGSMLPQMQGVNYVAFLAGGVVCSSTMNTATFEAMYSAFSRMHVQRTWDAIINAPLTLDDVALGEWVWAASKSLLSGCAVLVVAAALGLVGSAMALFIVPVILLTGLVFAGLGLIMTALSPSYDFFMYYFTLAVTPMMLLCGVFFPLERLPAVAQTAAQVLPLSHAVALSRPLMNGVVPAHAWLHVLVLVLYAGVSYGIARRLLRKRILK